MKSGRGVNTVVIDGDVKHILELEPDVLCHEWTLLVAENYSLYQTNKNANLGWRGFVLRFLGIHLPQKP